MNEQKVVISRSNSVALLGGGAVVNLNYAAKSTGRRFAPVIPFQEPKDGVLTNRVASWGTDNLYPQNRIELIEKDSELPQLLDFKARMLRGVGVRPFKVVDTDGNGNDILVPATDEKKIWKWSKSRKVRQWLSEASVDFNYFYNTFPQMILSRDRSIITDIAHQETAFCRLSEQNKFGRITHAFLNARWDKYNEQYTRVLPVIDTRAVDDIEQLRREKQYSYIFRCKYPVPGNPFYSTPLHEGFFTGGWYDVSQAIPEAKKYIMQNMMLVRYHLEIADWWWEKRYPGFWEDYTEEQRMSKQQDELENFNDFLIGAKKAGKTITTDMVWDEDQGKYKSAWVITPIEDKEKEGKWIDDSREASMHKLRAMGLDPAIIGAGPGRDNASAGSGSDKWAAIKLYLATLPQHREVLLQPLNFIAEYNGWADRDIEFHIVDHSFFYTNTASEKKSTEKNENPNPKREAA